MDSKALALGADARILSLEEFRKTRKQRRRSLNVTRPLVALWFGAAAVAAAAVVWMLMSTAMRHGLVGLAVLLTVAAAIAWPAAGGYVRKVSRGPRARKAAKTRHPSSQRAPR